MADNGAAQVLAAAGTEAAFARIGIRERLYDEVLCMDIVRIRRNSCKCGSRVLICAEEVAHIGEKAEVFVVDCCVELLNTLGILHIEAVIFDHGADAELCSVLRDFLAGLCEAREHRIKRAEVTGVACIANGCVVAHAGDTEDVCDVYVILYASNLFIEVAVAAGDEVAAHDECGNLKADALAFLAELFGVGETLFLGAGAEIGEIDKLNGIKAEFLGLRDQLKRSSLAGADLLHVAVHTDGKFHVGQSFQYNPFY